MREIRIIENAIQAFSLDLSEMTVFTEAASGQFAWTPVMAAMAGAEKVFALAKDSRYATISEAREQVLEKAEKVGVADRISVVEDYSGLSESDIVTNSGAVRPLNTERIGCMKSGSVIPLMWETWEFREADLDIRACAEKDILVLGTNEMHSLLRTFEFVGMVALKLLFESGIELFRSKVLVVGGGHFGESVLQALNALDAKVACVCLEEDRSDIINEFLLGERLSDPKIQKFLGQADAVIFAEHHKENLLLGSGGELTLQQLKNINPDIKLTHISGWINSEELHASGIECHPVQLATAPRVMSVTTDYVGPKAVLELNVAGLKVGELMRRARLKYPHDIRAARAFALENTFCSNFSDEQIRKYGL
ncbi:MAG: hypothetical protein AAFP70_15035 [Calditrichota bacterium]